MTRPVVVCASCALGEDFTPPEEFSRDLRRADDFIMMAVTAAHKAGAGVQSRDIPPEKTGVYIGTAYGPLETNFLSLGSLIDDGEGQISPTLFSHSVYNSAAGYVARLLDIRGQALTLTTYGWPFLNAMHEARLAVAAGRVERAVVVGVETYSALLEDAYKRSYDTDKVPWQKGAVACILEPGAAVDSPLCYLDDIVISEANCDPADYLTRAGEEWQGVGLSDDNKRHPMAHAYAIISAFLNISTHDGDISWQIKAPFGQVRMQLSQNKK